MSYVPLLPDDDGEHFADVVIRSVIAAFVLACLFGLLAMTCGCTARQQAAPRLAPEIIEVKVPVPAPCPAPPEVPPLDLWTPMLDPDAADIQTIMRVLARDLAACVMSYEQAVELLRIYVQQGEVASAPPSPVVEP